MIDKLPSSLLAPGVTQRDLDGTDEEKEYRDE